MIHVTSAKMSVLDFKYKLVAQNNEVVQIFNRVMQYIKLADNIYDL